MTTKSYPHFTVNVEDISIQEPLTVSELPLHRPLFVIKAQQGVVNVPVWCPTFMVARKTFGQETFNPTNSTYFSAQAFYLSQTLPYCGAFIMRVADDAAIPANGVLELSVQEVDVPQYEKDGSGRRTVDSNGEFVEASPPVTEPGIELTWSFRELLGTEDKDALIPTTTGAVTTYPIQAYEATSPGLHGNDRGLRLSYDAGANDTALVGRVGSIFLTMSPVNKGFNASTTTVLKDKYGNTAADYCFRPNAIDPVTKLEVSADAVIDRNYVGNTALPFNVVSYPDNVEIISELVLAKETAVGNIAMGDAWTVNLFTGRDLDGFYYDSVQFSAASILLSPNVTHYMSGGADGSLIESTIEALSKQVYELTANPDLADKARYPFTAIIDHGATLAGKKDMLNFMDVRDDVKICVGTHTTSGGVLAAAEDESLAAVLNSYALLMKESVIKGTSCCRALVFMQSGIPIGGYGNTFLPMTLWYAIKKAMYNNKTFLDKETKGRPNSDIEMFKKISWTPNNEDIKERSWDAGANYCQYATMTIRHYAGVRTVYPYDSSVLVDDTFTDAIIYFKHAIRESWAVHAGLQIPVKQLHEKMRKDLETRLSEIVNGKYGFTVIVYQTDEEARVGYIQHVTIAIEGPASSRVWEVDVVCSRENVA